MLGKYVCMIMVMITTLLLHTDIQAQSSIIDHEVLLPEGVIPCHQLIAFLEKEKGVVLSFNGRGIDLDKKVTLIGSLTSIGEVIDLMFSNYDYRIVDVKGSKVLIVFDNIESQIQYLTVRGKVYDKITDEVLVGATIHDEVSNANTFTNEYGFYSLRVNRNQHRLVIHYLGYEDTSYSEIKDGSLDVLMRFINQLDSVMISTRVSESYTADNGGEKIDLDRMSSSGVTGESDIISITKSLPGVQSGNEGQTGFYVRGGSPDQNLILLDGIPLYEVSHVVGLSSIFIKESIRDVNLIKNGFPARYAGRLNSVLSIVLKEGNKSDYQGMVETSLTGMKFQLEGPISKGRTSFNIAGRKSWLNLYLNDIYTSFTEYDDIGIDYHDVTAKLTHKFSPTKKITVSYYTGNDKFGIRRDEVFGEESNVFEATAQNDLEWGTTLANMQFSNVIKDNLFFNFSLGGVRYKYQSVNAYTFDSQFGEILTSQRYNVRTFTEIVDYIGSVNFDYFLNERHRVKVGGTFTVHNYKPEIRQSDIAIDSQMVTIEDPDLLIPADEYGLYIEDTYTPSDNLQMYLGVHLSGFKVGENSYSNVQPRLRMVYQPTKTDRLEMAYAHTAQYIHLLVNPGTGLPSELWVPSTESILPETAKQGSFSYTKLINNNIKIKIGGYVKKMKNVLEYQSPVDLVFAVLNNIPDIDDSPWNERVISGESRSRGLEFQLEYNSPRWETNLSYTWAKTDRMFEEINEGKPFPFKYDRRHDVNVNITFKISNNFSISSHWVYGDGNSFTLSVEEVQTIPGVPILIPGDRNNRKFPPFHFMNLQLDYKYKLSDKTRMEINFGIYNAYNRQNSFYLYLFENPINGDRVFRKVSIFPTLPHLNIGFFF